MDNNRVERRASETGPDEALDAPAQDSDRAGTSRRAALWHRILTLPSWPTNGRDRSLAAYREFCLRLFVSLAILTATTQVLVWAINATSDQEEIRIVTHYDSGLALGILGVTSALIIAMQVHAGQLVSKASRSASSDLPEPAAHTSLRMLDEGAFIAASLSVLVGVLGLFSGSPPSISIFPGVAVAACAYIVALFAIDVGYAKNSILPAEQDAQRLLVQKAARMEHLIAVSQETRDAKANRFRLALHSLILTFFSTASGICAALWAKNGYFTFVGLFTLALLLVLKLALRKGVVRGVVNASRQDVAIAVFLVMSVVLLHVSITVAMLSSPTTLPAGSERTIALPIISILWYLVAALLPIASCADTVRQMSYSSPGMAKLVSVEAVRARANIRQLTAKAQQADDMARRQPSTWARATKFGHQ